MTAFATTPDDDTTTTEDGADGSVFAGYDPSGERPTTSFVGLLAAYGAFTATGVAAARRGGKVPDRLSPADLALMAVSTHQITRVLSKSPVTSPLWASW